MIRENELKVDKDSLLKMKVFRVVIKGLKYNLIILYFSQRVVN